MSTPGTRHQHDGTQQLDAVVERVLDEVRRQGGAGAGPVEAVVRADLHRLALTRFAGSGIHQNTEDERTGVHLRVALDGGRSATVSTTRTTTAALADLVGAALAAARLSPRDAAWPGLAGPARVPAGAGPDDATAGAGPAERAALVAAFVEAAGGLETAGYAQTTLLTSAVADTAGLHARASSTGAVVDGIARALPASGLDGSPPDASFRADGVGRAAARSLADLDAAALGARAARRARAQAAPAQPLRRGELPVVLEPSAVLDVVAGLLSSTFSGRGLVEGTSGVRLGEQQLDPALTLLDDPLDPASTALPFDTEGTPASRTELVRDGVPRAVTTDRRTAAALAARGGLPALPTTAGAHDASDTWGPVAQAPVLAPGSGGSVDELVAGLEHGLLVCDLWYTRLAEARRSVWTGLTRNGTFLVRDGEVVGPVGVLRFTQSYLEALAPGAVTVGSDAEALPRSLTFGAAGTARVVVPPLRLARWNVTGGAAT
ncbi:metallopeptidase TldD-related protein [Quadrisphaera sp. INWT6]|uniref:metallopeptidase TldD-related protein n=1 Tax=Quadrisphaera sp. INWT6 TaxID=2596917 RepID=UPI00189255D4|nr:metallopeptidase TldD-related protein [Quadrisphaera sp. INWT6]MBF5081589.1 TldD/PmbA family protein [Quadrisphaera sp. INWT6]